MGSPERRRKRRRSMRARIGFRASYERGAGYWRRMSRLPNVAVLFSVVMMAAVCVRKMVMSSAKARSAELWARNRAKRAPLAVLLDEQHQIHSQAAALSDPTAKCLSHTNGGHKQPVTFGVFTCVADARFLLRALILMKGSTYSTPMLVVDLGTPPASDAGGITAGRGWDLRERKQDQVHRRVKFREEPLPKSSGLVLIQANKPVTVKGWHDVIHSVLKLLTANGTIVLMEQRLKVIPPRDIEEKDRSWPGSAILREVISDLACGKTGLAVALGAFDEGIAVVRRAKPDRSRLERGCMLADEVVDESEPDDGEEEEEGYTSGEAVTGSSSSAVGTTSAIPGNASAATGTASTSSGTASPPMVTALAATSTEEVAAAAEAVAAPTEAVAAPTEAVAAPTEAVAAPTEAVAAPTETVAEATATGTVAPPPPQPLLRFEELFSFAMGATWTPEAVQTKFGGADAVRKYAHRAGSRLFCVKNLARDSEGTGLKKQTKKKPSGNKGEGSRMLRSLKQDDGSDSKQTTPEKTARVCLEKHMKKHPKDVRGAFVLEMVLQAGGGEDGVDIDKQVARLREDACTQRGEAGLSLWKALHARGAGAGALGLLLP